MDRRGFLAMVGITAGGSSLESLPGNDLNRKPLNPTFCSIMRAIRDDCARDPGIAPFIRYGIEKVWGKGYDSDKVHYCGEPGWYGRVTLMTARGPQSLLTTPHGIVFLGDAITAI